MVGEWVSLTEMELAKKLGHGAQVSKGGRGKEGGISAASRELGIERTAARRAVKVFEMDDDAKEAVKELGLENNPSIYTKAAEGPKGEQKQKLLELAKEREKRRTAPKINIAEELESNDRDRIEQALQKRAEKLCPEPLSYTAKLLGVDVRAVKAVQAEIEQAIRKEADAASAPRAVPVESVITVEMIKAELPRFDDAELEDIQRVLDAELEAREEMKRRAAP
jgi:ParB family chromosome partitioning protein